MMRNVRVNLTDGKVMLTATNDVSKYSSQHATRDQHADENDDDDEDDDADGTNE